MPERSRTVSLEEQIPRFHEAFDALERGDLDTFTSITRQQAHPECRFRSAIGSAVGGATYDGVEGIRTWFGDLIATTSAIRWRDRTYEIRGESILIFLADVELTGIASGARVENEVAAVFEYEDGLCVRINSFMSHDEARGFANARGVETAFAVLADEGPHGLLDRFEELFDEHFEWRPALVGGLDGRVYRGRAGFEQYWEDFTGAFAEVELREPRAEPLGPDRVLASGTMHVRGAGGGVPIDQEAGFVFDVRDGKVIAGRTFFSRAEAEEFARA